MKKRSFNNTGPRGRWLMLGILMLTVGFRAAAQDSHKALVDSFDITKWSLLLPQPHPPRKYMQAVYVDFVFIPKDWTLDFINAPMFRYEGKYALPYGFTLQGSFSSLIISNRLTAGPFWNYKKGRYYFGAGWQVAFNLGILNQLGYKTKMVIWEQQPGIRLGYSFKRSAIVLNSDLIWTNAFYESQGGHVVPRTSSVINGYGFGASFEQRLGKTKIMSFGFGMNYLKYHFIAWPAFPVNQYRYWVPETRIGFEF